MIRTPLVIVGAQGMLGQDIARVFAEYRAILLDKAELDITNAAAVQETLTRIAPCTVINTAAYNMVDNAETEPGRSIAMAVNATGPGNLAATCAAINATLVHYSSDYVFRGDKKEGYTEQDTPDPQSVYAQSKYRGEVNVLNAVGRAYVIRTCKLFGQSGISSQAKKSFVDIMLHLAETKDHIDAVDDEYASPTYTPDLAAQTKVLLEGEYAPGIYHVTNTGGCTWYAFAVEIMKQLGLNVPVYPVGSEAFPRPAKRPMYSVLLNTKLPPMRSWQDALRVYLTTLNRTARGRTTAVQK